MRLIIVACCISGLTTYALTQHYLSAKKRGANIPAMLLQTSNYVRLPVQRMNLSSNHAQPTQSDSAQVVHKGSKPDATVSKFETSSHPEGDAIAVEEKDLTQIEKLFQASNKGSFEAAYRQSATLFNKYDVVSLSNQFIAKGDTTTGSYLLYLAASNGLRSREVMDGVEKILSKEKDHLESNLKKIDEMDRTKITTTKPSDIIGLPKGTLIAIKTAYLALKDDLPGAMSFTEKSIAKYDGHEGFQRQIFFEFVSNFPDQKLTMLDSLSKQYASIIDRSY